jgi:hypothetical protein
MEMESFEEEQLMDSSEKGDESDLTSLPDSDSDDFQKPRRASAYEDEDGMAIRSTATQTAEDFATLIPTKDDPSLSPWTFRVWFTGLFSGSGVELLMVARDWAFDIWRLNGNHVLLQARNRRHIEHLPRSDQLYPRRVLVTHTSTAGRHRENSQSSSGTFGIRELQIAYNCKVQS